jgi:hypothetical protein
MRKTKLTLQIQKAIGDKIVIGAPLKFAAEASGIDESTFYRWLQRGEKEKSGIYYEFRKYIMECEAKSVIVHLNIITRAANDGDPKASEWILERRFPEHFGRREKLDVDTNITTRNDIPMTPEVIEASNAYLKALSKSKSKNTTS